MSTDTVLLAQIIGVEQGTKQRVNKDLASAQRVLKALPQMSGVRKTYKPIREDDPEAELVPEQAVNVQVKVQDVIAQVRDKMIGLWDVIYTREAGNTVAKGDIVVGDVVIARDVPVTFLLGMEKQLADLRTILREIPVLDPSKIWHWDETTGTYASAPEVTHRTKKLPFVLTKAPATDKHQAATEVLYEDKIVGYYTKTDYSGALPAEEVRKMVQRVEALQNAVRVARLAANATQVEQRKIGKALFDYVLAP